MLVASVDDFALGVDRLLSEMAERPRKKPCLAWDEGSGQLVVMPQPELDGSSYVSLLMTGDAAVELLGDGADWPARRTEKARQLTGYIGDEAVVTREALGLCTDTERLFVLFNRFTTNQAIFGAGADVIGVLFKLIKERPTYSFTWYAPKVGLHETTLHMSLAAGTRDQGVIQADVRAPWPAQDRMLATRETLRQLWGHRSVVTLHETVSGRTPQTYELVGALGAVFAQIIWGARMQGWMAQMMRDAPITDS